MDYPKKIGVVGAGAVGSLFGGLLGEGGLEVTLIDVWKEHIDAIKKHGLRMTGHGGDRVVDLLPGFRSPIMGLFALIFPPGAVKQVPAQNGHHLPLAVTFGLFAPGESQRPLFSERVEGWNEPVRNFVCEA